MKHLLIQRVWQQVGGNPLLFIMEGISNMNIYPEMLKTA